MRVIDERRFHKLVFEGQISHRDCHFLDGMKIGLRIKPGGRKLPAIVDAAPDAFLVTDIVDLGQSSFEPGELYLFQTVEEISISNSIFGFLHTRSSLARLGINSIGSSYYVAPGYGHGVPSSLILEVTSVKTVINLPIEDPIAGLISVRIGHAFADWPEIYQYISIHQGLSVSKDGFFDYLSRPLEIALGEARDATRSKDGHRERAHNLLNILVHQGGIRDLVLSVLQHEQALEGVAHRSLMHENGFAKIPLLKDEAIAVRLHIWDSAGAGVWSGNIHDHRFSFWSHVVCGSLWQRNWREAVSRDRYSRYRYYPGSGTGIQILEYEGERTLVASTIQEILSGSTYFFPARELHQTRVDDPATVTLLVEDRLFMRPYALVYSHRYDRRDIDLRAGSLSLRECRSLLERVLQMIV